MGGKWDNCDWMIQKRKKLSIGVTWKIGVLGEKSIFLWNRHLCQPQRLNTEGYNQSHRPYRNSKVCLSLREAIFKSATYTPLTWSGNPKKTPRNKMNHFYQNISGHIRSSRVGALKEQGEHFNILLSAAWESFTWHIDGTWNGLQESITTFYNIVSKFDAIRRVFIISTIALHIVTMSDLHFL